jgi:hypothetical protein
VNQAVTATAKATSAPLIGNRVAVGARWDDVSGIEDGGAMYIYEIPEPSTFSLMIVATVLVFGRACRR